MGKKLEILQNKLEKLPPKQFKTLPKTENIDNNLKCWVKLEIYPTNLKCCQNNIELQKNKFDILKCWQNLKQCQ